ncbi:MAG: inorganic phosphate transporter [Acidobacteriaceae bacterium]
MDPAIAIAEPPPLQLAEAGSHQQHFNLNRPSGKAGTLIFLAALIAGSSYIAVEFHRDLASSAAVSPWTWVLLGTALAVALVFHFVNGFHDTANAVATVIYTQSLRPGPAVVWSGIWNLVGVLTSSGAVAFAILALLPADTILQAGSRAGFSILFALLIAALLWNLGTWWLGLPVSSSHTLIGSIIGVGLANQYFGPHPGASGVDWGQAASVFKVLLISPIVGFGGAALLLLLLRHFVRDPALYQSPHGDQPPPLWIRCLLILTCTGVSFGHGSNDGQKGMGLIMLILIGTVPTAYSLNHTIGQAQLQRFAAESQRAEQILQSSAPPADPAAADPPPQVELASYIRTRRITPQTLPAAAAMASLIRTEVAPYRSLTQVPANRQRQLRSDMYLTGEALSLLDRAPRAHFTPAQSAALETYRGELDDATHFIPTWVKVAVALALGLGTMVGWKRIVVTVGERIGKQHLTYAQGAVAEIVAAVTIIGVNMPVSTTHVLSSGVAGTMTANGSGLRKITIRNIALAWVLTLPAAALLAAAIFWVLHLFG